MNDDFAKAHHFVDVLISLKIIDVPWAFSMEPDPALYCWAGKWDEVN